MKELLIKLHRLEDELAGATVVTEEVEIKHLVNRIECARQELLEIINLAKSEMLNCERMQRGIEHAAPIREDWASDALTNLAAGREWNDPDMTKGFFKGENNG